MSRAARFATVGCPIGHPLLSRMLRAVTVGVLACVAAAAAFGDVDHRPGADRMPEPAAYRPECASCHVAYPPRLLPAASWRRLMTDLPHHFGTDASLDEPTRQALADWLVANAGSGRRDREAPPQDRITLSSWFVHEHDEVPAGAWKRAAVKSPSNCSACHTQADRGDFDEHGIRIPR
jgi:hypothetical protein